MGDSIDERRARFRVPRPWEVPRNISVAEGTPRAHLRPRCSAGPPWGGAGTGRGGDELDRDAVGVAQLQRRFAELEDDAVVRDAGGGEMRGPGRQRVAVGDREREVVER